MKAKSIILQSLYVAAQCTWGLLQTLAGFCVFLQNIKRPHEFYHGCIKTKMPNFGGLSLGLFIFVSDENDKVKPHNGITATGEVCRKIAVHEYGHTIQSLILGPLYLLVIGLPSLIWAGTPYFVNKRRENSIPYSRCFAEGWANRLGEFVLKQESIRDMVI